MMAKFRDSSVEEVMPPPLDSVINRAASSAPAPAGTEIRDRSIGELLRVAKDLSAEEVERILGHQRQHGVRFGEAAMALGLVNEKDVLFALSQQFHYPYAPGERYETSAELVALNQPFSSQAEAIRGVRSQLLMRVFGEAGQRALAVVSADEGDGKTFFAANLAVSLAQLGGRTLLVDADLRGPRLHTIFGLPLVPGLSGILSGRAESKVIQQVPAVPELFVMTGGTTPPNPLELIERPAFFLLMKELSAKFDHVIIDTPAAMYGTDGIVIGAKCGASIVIARRNQSRIASLQDLLMNLSDMRSRIAGVVYNEY